MTPPIFYHIRQMQAHYAAYFYVFLFSIALSRLLLAYLSGFYNDF